MSLIALLLFESIFGVECKLKAPLFWLLFWSLEYCDEQVEDLDAVAKGLTGMDRFKAVVDSDPDANFSAVGKVVGIFCSHSSTRFWELYRGGCRAAAGADPPPCKRGLTETTTELEFNFSRGDKTAKTTKKN